MVALGTALAIGQGSNGAQWERDGGGSRPRAPSRVEVLGFVCCDLPVCYVLMSSQPVPWYSRCCP